MDFMHHLILTIAFQILMQFTTLTDTNDYQIHIFFLHFLSFKISDCAALACFGILQFQYAGALVSAIWISCSIWFEVAFQLTGYSLANTIICLGYIYVVLSSCYFAIFCSYFQLLLLSWSRCQLKIA